MMPDDVLGLVRAGSDREVHGPGWAALVGFRSADPGHRDRDVGTQ
jgi:hypothetical protein